MRRILITGLSGLIGSALRKHVEGKYALRALNRRAVPGVETHQADLGDLAAIQPAFRDVDTVVHLAAAAGDKHAADVLMRSNVVGAFNVFEAARNAGVKRVIFASSGATVSGWERDPPLSHLVAGRYAEALGRHYSDAHRMSVICLRIGRVKAEDRPTTTRDVSVWCSQRDIVRMIEACIEAPESLRFDVFYVVSNLRHGYRDVEHARTVLGWTPMDSADTPR